MLTDEKIQIVNPLKKGAMDATIQFTLDFGEINFISDSERVSLHLQKAASGMDGIKKVESSLGSFDEAIEKADVTFGSIQDICKAWKSVFESVNLFMEIINKVSEVHSLFIHDYLRQLIAVLQIHPYAKMAWTVLSIPLKVKK
jgi:hypothetical protein